MKKIITSFLLLAVGLDSYTQELDFSSKVVDSIITNFRSNWNIPGISVAISKDGRLVYAKGFGYADTIKKEPVTKNSLFRIASCSKTITALGIMKLVEENKLNLNQKVFGNNGILNDSLYNHIVDERVNLITVQNLLQHTVGWPDLDIIGDNEASYALNLPIPAGKKENIKYMLLQKHDFDPASTYRYSNFNYLFLGEIISHVSGKSYENFIQTEIFKPIGINTTIPGGSKKEEKAMNEVIYYDYNGEKSPSVFDTTVIVPMSYSFNMIPCLPEGGWVARPVDMIKIILAFDGLNDPMDLLNQETINIMTTPPSGINSKYAMGMKSSGGMWRHSGALTWGTFALWFKTENNVCFAITCNTLPNKGKNDEEKMASLGAFFKDVFTTFPDMIKKTINYPNINLFNKEE